MCSVAASFSKFSIGLGLTHRGAMKEKTKILVVLLMSQSCVQRCEKDVVVAQLVIVERKKLD